jgi:hypothetical protein
MGRPVQQEVVLAMLAKEPAHGYKLLRACGLDRPSAGELHLAGLEG